MCHWYNQRKSSVCSLAEREAQQAAVGEEDLMKKNDFRGRDTLHSTCYPESIMMSNQDGKRIRVAKDACGVNIVRAKEKTPCNYSCFIFSQLWRITE